MMKALTLSQLQELVLQDQEQGLVAFRNLFFTALDARDWQACEATLQVLAAAPALPLQQAAQHYRAILLSEQRQFDQAETILRALLEQALSDQQRARTLLELANQLDELGQWQAAARPFTDALKLYERLNDDAGRMKVYNNLGISLCFQFEQGVADPKVLDQARIYHQTALDLAKTLGAPMEEMRNWHGLGRAYGLMGQTLQAAEAFAQQLSLSRALDDTYAEAVGLTDLATLVYLPQARLAEAQSLLQQAIDLLTAEADELHLAEALTQLGNLYAKQGRDEQAFKSYEAALTAVEALRSQLSAPIAKADYRATTDFVYTAPLTLHLQRGNASAALTLAERARARVLADLLGGHESQSTQRHPTARDEQREAIRIKLEQAYRTAAAPTLIDALESQLAILDRQIELREGELLSWQESAALTAEEIQQRLPADAVLLSYVSDTAQQLHCLITTPQQISHVPLNPQLRLNWLQAILPEYLNGQRQGFVPNRQGDLITPGLFLQLYQALIKPLLPFLAAAQRIYIVPTGALNHLPLGALAPDLQTTPPLLAHGRQVCFAPSATILLRYCHQRPPSPHQGLITLAPTAPDLHLMQSTAVAVTKTSADGYQLGAAVNRTTFLRQTGAYRMICFLGHAFFNAQHPMLSHLQLSDGRLQASEISRELRIHADLVVLGACETGRSQILRGDEILGLSRALLYAGTPALLVTAWKVHELPMRLFTEHFFAQLAAMEQQQQRFDPAQALAVSQNWLRTLTDREARAQMATWDVDPTLLEQQVHQIWRMQQPREARSDESRLFVHPFFWAPYMLIGEPNPSFLRQ